MARMDIRNMPEDVVLRLSDKAKTLGMSREAYARDILIMAANADIVEETEEKYKTLFNEFVNLSKEQGEIIQRCMLMMQILNEKIE